MSDLPGPIIQGLRIESHSRIPSFGMSWRKNGILVIGLKECHDTTKCVNVRNHHPWFMRCWELNLELCAFEASTLPPSKLHLSPTPSLSFCYLCIVVACKSTCCLGMVSHTPGQ